MINIYKPFLNKNTNKYAIDAIKSTWISSNGKYLDLVKDKLLQITNNKYVLLCNNGTTATHLMAIGLKYKYPKIKNLIVPNNVYVAAWNSFLINPVFNLIPIDSNLNTWNIDMSILDKAINQYSYEDTAVLIVHNIGNIINVPSLKEKYPNYIFIEDNCEGFLGEYNDFKSGSKSLMSSVSFYGNKTVTSGEGGALFTDDEDLYLFLESTRTQGSTIQKFIFDKIGYNYRMTNIQAAILYGQLENLDIILHKKKHIFDLYKSLLKDYVSFQEEETYTKHSNWMFGFKLNKNVSSLNKILNNNDVETRPMFCPISKHKHLAKFKCEELNSNILYENCLILPSYPSLKDKEIRYICKLIKENLD